VPGYGDVILSGLEEVQQETDDQIVELLLSRIARSVKNDTH
jgi:hypothetical protein